MTIKPDITPEEFTKQAIGIDGIAGTVLGVVFEICRIFGVVVLIWGIYSYITVRKDGHAEEMTSAMVKIVLGVILIAIEAVFRAVGIIV